MQALPGPVVALVGLAALLVVSTPTLWRLAEHVDTMAHEGAHEGLQEVISYGLTWLLLLSGARTAMVHGVGAGDADSPSATTHLPRRLWALLWIAGTLLAIVIGGKWLILRS
jgi:hypothetical protein